VLRVAVKPVTEQSVGIKALTIIAGIGDLTPGVLICCGRPGKHGSSGLVSVSTGLLWWLCSNVQVYQKRTT